MPTTHYRACHLCEAICGLKIVTEGDEITSITGDKDDPLSRGHICPKGVALKDLHNDPDRLTTPIHKVDGKWQTIEWDEAYKLVATNLHQISSKYGNDAVGFYAGNPNVHNYGHMTHGPHFSRLLKTKNRFSATSVDQLPHHLVSYWMYGHMFLLPIADIDHTDFMLILGANPMASNGSLFSAPDIRARLKAVKNRGGELVVIDPRRTETAKLANAHHFIRPGTDAALLVALIQQLFARKLVKQNHLEAITDGIADIETAVASFTPEWAAEYCGIDAETISNLAERLAAAPSAAIYGRMGVSTHSYGTLCQWAVQVLNILTGNLDSVGGCLVTNPAVNPAGPTDRAKGHFNRWQSRVRGLPEFAKELPCAAMTEEINTAGEGQIKAMITVAGNPVLSTPNGDKLGDALAGLEFMVSIDPYLNETTRYADLILPPASPLAHSHYDLAFSRLAIRNTAKFTPAIFARTPEQRYDHELFNGLALALAKEQGVEWAPLPEPEILLSQMLNFSPYNQNAEQEPLSLERLKANPSGIDLGPLRPSLSKRLCTDNQRIDAFPVAIASDLQRLASEMDKPQQPALRLIGKRDLRSNNSWMHNLSYLLKGKPRCVLFMHPDDMAARNINDGDQVSVANHNGCISLPVEASQEMMPSVVCMPHGWGHDYSDTQQQVANDNPGANMNVLTDVHGLDPVSGNAILSGFKVTVTKA